MKTSFKKQKQLNLFAPLKLSYGGELLNTRKGRLHGRPLDTKNSMHIVLRSSKAKGAWSFALKKIRAKIEEILSKFALKYGIKIDSVGNAGNHLHIYLKIMIREGYKPFIRAVTSAIMMAVTGASRWRRPDLSSRKSSESVSGKRLRKPRFWDYRPFSRVVRSFKAHLNMKKYVQINQLEGFGMDRLEAESLVKGVRKKFERLPLRSSGCDP